MRSAAPSKEREPLVDVCLGDDVAVDDRGGLDDRRDRGTEQLRILGEPERLTAVDAWPRLLGNRRRSGERGNNDARHPEA